MLNMTFINELQQINPEYRFTLVPLIVGCLGCSTNNIDKQPSETGNIIERKSSSSTSVTEISSHWITKSAENRHENVLKNASRGRN